jgi:parallel beta-helix repeat protein
MFGLKSPLAIGHNNKLYLIFFIILLFMNTVQAEKITVCKDGCDYTSIAAGVAAANPGETIDVLSGIYNEGVNITKPLRLRGLKTEEDLPVVDASGLKDSAITLSSDGIIIEGFKVKSAFGHLLREWAGIKVISNNNIIADNMAEENDNGILLTGSNNTLRGNIVSRNTNGIMLKESQDNVIENSSASSNNYGIYLISSTNNTLTGSNVTDNDFGIQLSSSTGNILRNNVMDKNTNNFGAEGENDVDKSNLVEGKLIYYLIGVSDPLIIDASSEAGTVYCINCSNVIIQGLRMENNLFGVLLYKTTNSMVENNTLNNNSHGMRLIDSTKNIIRNNILSNNRVDGIAIDSSEDNIIEKNNISGNSLYGVNLLFANYNNITTNRISRNSNGLVLNQSDNNQVLSNNRIDFNKEAGLLMLNSIQNDISRNSFAENTQGAWLVNSLRNNITSNNVSGCTDGIRLEFSSNNAIIQNSIIENTHGIAFDPSYNNLGNNSFTEHNWMSNNKLDMTDITSTRTACPPGGCRRSKHHSDSDSKKS